MILILFSYIKLSAFLKVDFRELSSLLLDVAEPRASKISGFILLFKLSSLDLILLITNSADSDSVSGNKIANSSPLILAAISSCLVAPSRTVAVNLKYLSSLACP